MPLRGRALKRVSTEVAVLGAGFGGSLMALVLERLGREVTVLERARHPRFALGESSTPLADLILEQLCRRYAFDSLLPLCKWGSWQRAYPELSCGLKRGFSFFKHEEGAAFHRGGGQPQQLLVAASPNDELGDTQWFRSELDAFLAGQLTAKGIELWEESAVSEVKRGDRWRLSGRRRDRPFEVVAEFVIDATGSGTALRPALGLVDHGAAMKTTSRAIFSHFSDVAPWRSVLEGLGVDPSGHPFPCDDAALHHILDDGWLWMLRFNNGLTSVGAVLADPVADRREPDEQFGHFVARCPSVAEQLRNARPVRPVVASRRLQRRLSPAAGPGWALLPHAASFVDPLLSTGIAHTLIGIERLGRIFEGSTQPGMAEALGVYDRQLQDEIDFVDTLVHGCYLAFPHFELLAAFTMYYFAGAIFSEDRRRRGEASPGEGLLHSHEPRLRRAVIEAHRGLEALLRRPNVDAADVARFTAQVAEDIAPFNLAGLCDPARHHLYPFIETAAQPRALTPSGSG